MASRKRHELLFKAANCVAASGREASTVASTARCSSKIWGSARMAAIATSSARAAPICFSAAKCSLRSWLYCVHHGLGRCLFGGGSVIWVEGVALVPAVGACGMWKEEEDGGRVWITCLDR